MYECTYNCEYLILSSVFTASAAGAGSNLKVDCLLGRKLISKSQMLILYDGRDSSVQRQS